MIDALPISIEVLRRELLATVERDAIAIQAWLRGGAEPDFAAIASYVLPALQTILIRKWIRLAPDWDQRINTTITIDSNERNRGFRGAVAETLELVRWALRQDRPPPPRGPPAAVLALDPRRA